MSRFSYSEAAVTVGLDIGSRGVKAVSCQDGRISQVFDIDTISFYRALSRGDHPFPGLSLAEMPHVVTGYGRLSQTVRGAQAAFDEMSAHRAGAAFLTDLDEYVLLDIGGQDTKVMSVRNGLVEDMDANDRCAASSGRFIENIADLLGVPLAEFLATAAAPVPLSSTCAVFAESEIVEAVARGVTSDAIAAGVLDAVYTRLEPMLLRMGEAPIVLTGGLAGSPALTSLIAERTGRQVIAPAYARHAGAIGCLLIAGALAPHDHETIPPEAVKCTD